jgi:hypothetical protein
MAWNLFYRRVPPSEIKVMAFHELVMWNEMHEGMAKEEDRITQLAKGNNG